MKAENGGPGYVTAASRKGLCSSLENISRIIDFAVSRGLRMYRMSSDIAPYITHPEKPQYHGQLACARETAASVGARARDLDVRLSFHPSQFVVLNSPEPRVVANAIGELDWHARVLDAMGQPAEAKMVIHGGGVYGEKEAAMERFVQVTRGLPEHIRARLVLENDEFRFGIADVLAMSRAVGHLPVVFDHFHHQVATGRDPDYRPWLEAALATWGPGDGTPKIHMSSQHPDARPGTHGESVNLDDFAAFYLATADLDYDIMVEAKNKDLAAAKLLPVVEAIDGDRAQSGQTGQAEGAV